MLRTWLEPEEIEVPEEYTLAIGGSRMVSQVLYRRGYQDIEAARGFLSPKDFRPSRPAELAGLTQAVEILLAAIKDKQTIGVWGDFDVDGQTSTTVLVSSLREQGGRVIYHIPVRAEESHGISLPGLRKFLDQQVDLIVTCDTGISSHEAIDYAGQKGVPVIITDHHDLPESLPKARCIVNPKLLPAWHPLANLPGVGVAYKIAEELYEKAGEPEAANAYLDLAALGIVADIALLRGDTRYLLQRGLQTLRSTGRAGLKAIMELAELNQANLTEEHIGYILAPRMNALGRLDDANSMVELLTTSDLGRARLLALELEGMNAQRKLLTDQVYKAAQAQIDNDPRLLEQPVLVLAYPSWPAGVIGIVASRLVEQYHRPTILLASPPGQEARGSARSIEGINITSAIAANRELVKGFGGHPMAAGLSMDAELIPRFRLAMARSVREMGVEVQAEKELQVDGYLTLPELSLELVEDLERLAPFGAGNPPLVFATRNLHLTGYAAVGRAAEHLQLTVEDELGHTRPSIWWQGAGYTLPEGKFDLSYSVRASTYRGQRDVQIEWIDYRQADRAALLLTAKKRQLELVDNRQEPQPLDRIKEINSQGGVAVWAEAVDRPQEGSADRLSIQPAEALAIWTIPPGPQELQALLRRVDPVKVYLFAIDPQMDRAENLLKRLSGLVKNSLSAHRGLASLASLAAATAQRENVIKAGLQWLEGNGHIRVKSMDRDEVHLEPGAGKSEVDMRSLTARLNALLAESAAYRRYYLTASKESLVQVNDEA